MGNGGQNIVWVGCLFGAIWASHGCGNTTVPDENVRIDDALTTPAPFPTTIALQPGVAALGGQVAAQISGLSTQFTEGIRVSLGDDILIEDLEVMDANLLGFTFTVPSDAMEGYRTLTVRTGSENIELEQALLIQQGAVSINPTTAMRGQTIALDVYVEGVELEAGYTWLGLGEGVAVTQFELDELDPSHAVAQITVDSDAVSGPRDIELQHGDKRIVLPGGFTVDRGLIAVVFEPIAVAQGSEVAYTITGYGTHFDAEMTEVNLGVGVVLKADNESSLVVVNPTLITGVMTVCESAVVGDHSVTVTSERPSGPAEVVTALEGFYVKEVQVTAEQAYGVFYLNLYRTMRDGGMIESVDAYASIRASMAYCPVNQDSGGSSDPDCAVSPEPFDNPVFYPPEGCDPTEGSSSGSSAIYPPSPAFDAGEHIYFEIPGGPSIRLDKYEDLDGSLYYANAEEIAPEDVWFDAAYDVIAEGAEGDYSVGAFVAEGVLVTPVTDFILVAPDLRDEPLIDRYDAFEMYWSDLEGQPGAGTFPVSTMYTYLRTSDATTGQPSYIQDYPLDDGAYVFPAELVSRLYPGSGRFRLQVTRPGLTFTIPGSLYSSYTGGSIAYTGYFELR